jgi:hypothetical protein
MLQMGNQAPGTRPLPGAYRGSAQGPSPLQAVPGALGGCEAVTFRRTTCRVLSRLMLDTGWRQGWTWARAGLRQESRDAWR